jgi:hypothetical protein
MPAVNAYPDDPIEIDRLLDGERKQRADYIGAGWQYYKGKHKRPLKVKPGQPDPNVTLNLCRKLVDTGAAMLFGQGVTFELTEGETTPEEKYLERVWNASRGKLLLNDIAINGGVAGHAVARIVPSQDEGGLPRILNVTPGIFHAFWKADDVDTALFYLLEWSDEARQEIINDNGVWLIRDYAKDAGKWQLKENGEQRWPYPWPPIIDWKNLPNPNEYYGLSDLEHADLNDSVNFLASNINSILYHHAHPKTIGTGMTAKEVQETAVGGFWTVPNPDAKIFNLEMQSDLSSSMSFLELLRNVFFSQGAQVDLSSMKDKLGSLTNFALRVLYFDAINRLRLKRLLYGEALRELNRRLLELGGMGADMESKLIWPYPLPEDEVGMAQVIRTDMELGLVSKETASKRRGYSWDTEQKRIADEKQGDDNLGAALLAAFERGQ